MLGGTGAIGTSIIDVLGNNNQYEITVTSRQNRIEQNRCAMACQGCGAVFLLLNKKAVETKSYK